MSKLFNLQNKNVLLTGASKGMGLAMAQGMVNHGANVVISSRKLDQCEKAAKTINDSVDQEKSGDKKKVAEQGSAAVSNLRVLENIEVKLTVEVGNTEIKIKDLLRLNEGSVVELERLAGEPLDILANGTKIAKGEVVMVGEKFGIRFTLMSFFKDIKADIAAAKERDPAARGELDGIHLLAEIKGVEVDPETVSYTHLTLPTKA